MRYFNSTIVADYIINKTLNADLNQNNIFGQIRILVKLLYLKMIGLEIYLRLYLRLILYLINTKIKILSYFYLT